MLVDTLNLLNNIEEGRGVNAFNVFNLESVKAIIEVAEEKMIPVIIQISESALNYADKYVIFSMIKKYIMKVDAPVSIHLDHGRRLEIIKDAIEMGFQSVMVDGSYLPYEENVQFTKNAVILAHKAGIPVEGEIGKIGGVEDNIVGDNSYLVPPDTVIDFVRKTGIDMVAPALGTSHGAYKFKSEQMISFDNILRIKESLSIPIVLHGASSLPEWLIEEGRELDIDVEGMKGVPYDDLKKAVKCGVKKLNSDTDLRLAFTIGIKKSLFKNKKEINPRVHILSGIEMMKKIIEERMVKLWENQ